MTTITVNDVRSRLRSRRWIRAIAVGLLFGLAGGLVAIWLVLLAHRPRLTPLLAAVAIDYRWPVEPNAWAGEDLARIRSLHRQSLRVSDLSADWRSRDLALRRLDQELTTLVTTRSISDTVVVYLSLHGVVDEKGQPHLLPTEASPLDSSTWLPVREVLDLICQKLPPSINKLVVLDSNRSGANWRVGQLHNTFADRLAGAIDPGLHPGVVILNSTSANQIGWSGPSLTGSLFGRLLIRSLGTAGVDATGGTGAKRGKVRLWQLVDDVNRQMEAWCRTHQLPAQAARVYPEDAADFSISWALDVASVEREFQRLALEDSPTVSPLERDALWRQAGDLPRPLMLAAAPEKLNEIEQQLLWLEKLAVSGSAYERQARLHEAVVKRNLSGVATALKDPVTRASPVALRGSLLTETRGARGANAIRSVPAPSLEVSATLGSLAADEVDAARRQWQELTTGLSAERIAATITSFDRQWQVRSAAPADLPGREGAEPVLAERAQSLRLLTRYQTLERWSRRDPIVATLRLASESDRLSAMRTRDGIQELRATDWVRITATLADQSRWLLDDLLLAGEPTSGAGIDAYLATAEQTQALAEQRLDDVTQAFALCDDAFQRLAFFASGLDDWLRADVGSGEADDADPVVSLVLPAMRDALLLGDQLDRGEVGSDGEALPFLEVAGRLRQVLRELDQRLADRIESFLIAPDMTGSGLLSLRAVLELPWIPWQSRRELRSRYDQVCSSLVLGSTGERTTGSGEVTSEPARQESVGLNGLDRVLSWSIHPASLFLLPVNSEGKLDSTLVAGTANQQIETAGALVRRSLAASPLAAGLTDLSYRDRLAAARQQRRGLPFASSGRLATPLEISWNERLQRWLCWHAERQLDAFVDLPPRGATRGTRVPDFERACERYLSLVALLGAGPADVQRELATLRGRQATRRLAARGGLVTEARTPPVPPPPGDATLDVSVTPGQLLAGTVGALPAGRPSVWVQDQSFEPVSTVASLELPVIESQTLRLQPLSGAAVDSPRLMATTMFRGNEFRFPFVVNRLAGPLVAYQPHVYGDSTITLLGERRKRVSILFVLDCSQSMAQALPDELGNVDGPTKLDAAKAALLTMLDELSGSDGARIGVVLLGHRLAWTRSDPPRLSEAPGAADYIPQGLLPSRDVETVLPLGRFDAGAVQRRLETIVPWGQTPLNLAVIEALRAFRADDPDTEKNVIVITDGRDYQFTPIRGEVRQPPRVTQADVERVAREIGVPVFVIGLGVPEGERQAAETEFQGLARMTGGETVAVEYASELLRQIRNRLTPGTFSIDGSSSRTSPSADASVIHATLNSTVRVDPKQLAGEPVRLIFESATTLLPLVGGEALQIQLAPDARSFLPVPFEWRLPQNFGLVTGQNDRLSPYVLRVHRPQAKGDAVAFPVSVQSTVDPLTPRPLDAWLVVTPLVNGGEMVDYRYWFYDQNYEPGQPVPVLNWVASGWPKEARSAKLDFWCRFEPTTPVRELPLRAILDRPADFSDYRMPEYPSIGFQFVVSDRLNSTSDYVINVIQRHDAAKPDLGQLRVEFLHGEGLRPSRVSHQFDAANGIVSHTFTFPLTAAAGLERSEQSRFVLTSRSASQSRSFRPVGGGGIEVDILADSDLIMINPPR